MFLIAPGISKCFSPSVNLTARTISFFSYLSLFYLFFLLPMWSRVNSWIVDDFGYSSGAPVIFRSFGPPTLYSSKQESFFSSFFSIIGQTLVEIKPTQEQQKLAGAIRLRANSQVLPSSMCGSGWGTWGFKPFHKWVFSVKTNICSMFSHGEFTHRTKLPWKKHACQIVFSFFFLLLFCFCQTLLF